MRRLLAISLLCIYLLSATEFRQLLKIPVLIEHYQEHQRINSGITFFGFMYMHYAGHDFNDNDQDRDMQLPFKSSAHAMSVLQLMPATFELPDKLSVPCQQIKFPDNNFFCQAYFASIWQPPKTGRA